LVEFLVYINHISQESGRAALGDDVSFGSCALNAAEKFSALCRPRKAFNTASGVRAPDMNKICVPEYPRRILQECRKIAAQQGIILQNQNIFI